VAISERDEDVVMPDSLGPQRSKTNRLIFDLVVCLVLLAFSTLVMVCMSVDYLEHLRGEAQRKALGQFVTWWLILAPIPPVLYMGSRILWRAVERAPAMHRIATRSAIVAFFFSPSLVGAAGPTGGVMLPGPAFVMLLFGQWQFKLWLGLLPILVCWPMILLVFCSRERWPPRRRPI
jgi:hypothetical protein